MAATEASSTSKSDFYHYQPLGSQEIRLLTIHAGSEKDPIKTSLHHASFTETLEYEALSYTWSKSIAKDPPVVDPETVVEVAIHAFKKSSPTNGKPKVEKVKWKDLTHHEHSYLYYSLGGPREPEHILCCGFDTVIGGELYSALKRLRKGDEDRVLWIDALCINQIDLNERAEQVAIMADIYARAKQVVIWLGENYSDVDPAVENIYAIAKKLIPIWKAIPEKESAEMLPLKIMAFKADPAVRKLHWDSIADLLKRAWFQRVWCIQEVVYGNEAILKFGNWEIDWKFFTAVIGTLRSYDLDSALWSRGECYGSATVNTIDELRRSDTKDRPDLPELLRKTRSYKSTLPSDKIFGLLNVVSETSRCDIRVDYTRDPSLLYSDFAVQHMQSQNSLEILYDCWASLSPSPLALPSWVPNWTQPLWHETIPSLNLIFAASGKSDPDFRFEVNTMIVKGRVLDTVSEVEKMRAIPRAAAEPTNCQGDPDNPPWRSPPGSKPWYYRDRDGKPFWESSHDKYFEESRQSRIAWITDVMAIAFPSKTATPAQYEELWRSFVWDLTPDGLKAPPRYGEDFSEWLIYITATDEEATAHELAKKAASVSLDLREEVGKEGPDQKPMGGWIEFSKANARCYNRRFYRSSNGRFGWGVDGIRKGDQVCVLHGAPAPFVLRPVEGGCHKIVGDTYIHGLMYGEGMKEDSSECTFRLI